MRRNFTIAAIAVLISACGFLRCKDLLTGPDDDAFSLSVTASPSSHDYRRVKQSLITASVSGTHGPDLVYTFRCARGYFQGDTVNTEGAIKYLPPAAVGKYGVQCTVTDGSQSVQASATVTVIRSEGSVGK